MNKNIIPSPLKIFSNPKHVFLFLTFLSGIILLFPFLDFQPWLSTGDHGRDLYCFQQTLEGQLPYRDYWWQYGPLMPYYYALFFKFFGINILSIAVGKMILTLLAGMFFYAAISLWVPSLWATIATLWFWTYNPDFFFTYNHIGGIAAYLATIYYLFLYIKNPANRYVYGGLFAIFILSLIKINIGLFTLLGFLSVLCLADSGRKNLLPYRIRLYAVFFFAVIAITLLIYVLFLWGLPAYYLRQCFPYLKADHQYYLSIIDSLKIYAQSIASVLSSNWPNFILCIVITLCAAQTVFLIFRKETDRKQRDEVFLITTAFLIFSILNLHEFLNSGVLYRTFWIAPFKFLFIFFCIVTALHNLSRVIKSFLLLMLVFILLLENTTRYQAVQKTRNPLFYLPFQTAKVYVANSPDWVDTVKRTTLYLEKTLKENETFFALPYDPLYYFFTQRDSPTRQLIFFDHLNIHPEQEKEIIQKLEEKKVNFILISSRCCNATETRLGEFGVTYCPLLGKYIREKFQTIQTFGDWTNDPGWAWNHGTKILKRIAPL